MERLSKEEDVVATVGDYKIKVFSADKLADVMRINKTCLPENYPSSFFIYLHQNFPKAFLIAEKDGEVVGYIMCRVEYGLSNMGIKLTRKGHVVSIAVMPGHRRKGIATALLRAAEKALKEYGAKEMMLEVRVSNTPAISLYKKLGYKEVKVLKRYYSDGEDAYLMAKELEEDDDEK
ncbi:MAG: ribosomal protein S18-alanine N-acetyltransferase [Candidatus Baldrarchaeia archaeon]